MTSRHSSLTSLSLSLSSVENLESSVNQDSLKFYCNTNRSLCFVCCKQGLPMSLNVIVSLLKWSYSGVIREIETDHWWDVLGLSGACIKFEHLIHFDLPCFIWCEQLWKIYPESHVMWNYVFEQWFSCSESLFVV